MRKLSTVSIFKGRNSAASVEGHCTQCPNCKDWQKLTLINLLLEALSHFTMSMFLVPNRKTVKTLLVTLPADIIHISLKIYNKLYHNFCCLSILIFMDRIISLCNHPIITDSCLCPKGYLKRHSVLHLFTDDCGMHLRKCLWRFKHQFVMNL